MDHKHRKNIRQERNKVSRAGIRFIVRHGDEASADELRAMHGFYLQTFAEYGNSPALTLPFLRHLAAQLPRQLVLFLALQDDEPIAGALCLRGTDTLYGRYWGGATLPGLHFETCYYQGIEYCLREGLNRFEPGAQGEHKLARGFLPTEVRSHHWIAHPEFRKALRDWCAHERAEVGAYHATLQRHSPFKTQDPP
jgi:predicted N-acyltransferase